MNTSKFFLAGILCVNLLGVVALPQATGNQAALVKQSSIVFAGTVSQLGATSFAGVPKSAQTVVVRVDSVLKKPSAVSLKKGDNVTVELKDPSAFQQGTQATFYTEGWIFGSGVAVKELGHEFRCGTGEAAKPASRLRARSGLARGRRRGAVRPQGWASQREQGRRPVSWTQRCGLGTLAQVREESAGHFLPK